MTRIDKITFIDKIVSLFYNYCPDMLPSVRYWVACQFALESNFGSSQRALNFHNLCGMRVPYIRFSLNTNSSGSFAHYNSDVDCVLDYVYWLAYNKFNCVYLSNLDLFRLHLKASKYCPDSDYIDKINSIYIQFNNQFN